MSLYPKVHAWYKGFFEKNPAKEARALHDELRDRLVKAGGYERILRQVTALITTNRLDEHFGNSLTAFVDELLSFDDLFRLPEFEWSETNSIARYWELSERCRTGLSHLDLLDTSPETLSGPIREILLSFVHALPHTSSREEGLAIPSSILHLIHDPADLLDTFCAQVMCKEWHEAKLWTGLRERILHNLIRASGGDPYDPEFRKPLVGPSDSKIEDRRELVATYVGGTPLIELFKGSLSFVLPLSTRFEHHHIVAGSGHGKTQTLQYLIAKDLEAVAEGTRSVVVIDSQGDLIRNIAGLKVFAPGEPLHDRVVIIDPTDVEYPVSLNLFDVGQARLAGYAQLERERLTNSIIELYDFVLGSLLSAEMTQKQNVIFRYVTRLMLHIPDATIQTLRELMEPKSEVTFAPHIAKLTGSVRHFFESEFGSSEFTQTRKQVLRRLWGILENQTFERMFSHPRSKLDLYEEMNAGKVILINTAKDLLKEGGTEIFGRFFIALIVQAAQERAVLPEHKRMPTFVYIDEAADYFDKNFATMLSQARKQKVGMVLAHQYLGQLEPRLLDAFAANTSIKFAGGVSTKDSRQLAQMLGTTAEFIEGQKKGSFAAYVRGSTESAIPLAFPLGYLEGVPKMDTTERAALLRKMREQHAAPLVEEKEPAERPKDTGQPRVDSEGYANEW